MSARRGKKPVQTLFAFAEEPVEERRRGIDEFFAAVPAYARGRRLLRLLEQMARFRAYGPYNAFLAALQRPRARCVLPVSRWRAYNRDVKAGAVPIILLRPFAPVTCVFDVADTHVRSGQDDRLPASLVADEAEPTRAVDKMTVQTLLARLPWWGIRHETVPTGPAAVGELHLAREEEPEMVVCTRDGGDVTARPVYVLSTRAIATPTERFTALTRELARLFCRHLRCGYERGWEGGRELPAAAESLEADLVVWLVSRRLGVASPVYSVVAERLDSNDPVEDVSIDAVLDAVAEIERMLGRCTVRDGYLVRHSPSFAAALR